MTKTSLIVVDVQKDFGAVGGSLLVPGGWKVVSAINAMMPRFDLVVATRDWHPAWLEGHFSLHPDRITTWPVHCVANTWGSEYLPHLDTSRFSAEIRKGQDSAAYSGFDGITEDDELFEAYLLSNDVTHVAVVGLALDYCVKATALDAVGKGFVTSVLLPACRSIAKEDSDALTLALEEMNVAGVQLIDTLPRWMGLK